MAMPNRAPRTRAVGRRTASETAPPIQPKAVTDQTNRLVELSDHCDAAKGIAEEMGEDFLTFLLSMVIEETRTAMRRATMGMPSAARKRRAFKSAH